MIEDIIKILNTSQTKTFSLKYISEQLNISEQETLDIINNDNKVHVVKSIIITECGDCYRLVRKYGTLLDWWVAFQYYNSFKFNAWFS